MKYSWLVVASLLIVNVVFASQLVKVTVDSAESVKVLMSGGYDIVFIEDESVQIIVDADDLEELYSLGFQPEILHRDLEAYYRSRLNYELDSMGGYPTWSEIRTWHDSMLQSYPNLISEIDTIGYSNEERPIWVFKISDNPNVDEDEPEVFLNAAIHAREVITPLILMSFTEYLCENYLLDPSIAELVNNREIWMLPVVNPDGYVYNEVCQPNGGGTWRKNRRRINDVALGVDLNRNWPYMWGLDDIGSSPDPDEITYRGQSAGSEPETVAMMDFINSHHFNIIVNYHSYSNLILYPFSHSMNVLPDDIISYEVMVDSMNSTLNWNAGPAQALMYSVNGDAVDWQEGACDYNTFSFVFEVGGVMDGFWPPTDRIEPLCNQQIVPLMFILRAAGSLEEMLPPLTPDVTIPDTARGDFTVSWSNIDTVTQNAPYSYDLIELSNPLDVDWVDPESNYTLWEMNDFSIRSDTISWSEPAVYFSGRGTYRSSSMVSHEWMEVELGDTLRFMTWYSLEPGWDYAYVQVKTSLDTSWTSIPGNITTEENTNGRNRGHGINGSVREWVEGIFPLDEYAGQSIKLRFLYNTSWLVGETGMFIDDISLFTTFENEVLICDGTTDTSAVIEIPDNLDQPEQRWYSVRSVDAQTQPSKWSETFLTVIYPSETGINQEKSIENVMKYSLSKVYPNPFNPTTSIEYGLGRDDHVTINIYNLNGRLVNRLENSIKKAGRHTIKFDGSNLASGFYFVQMSATEFEKTQKIILMK